MNIQKFRREQWHNYWAGMTIWIYLGLVLGCVLASCG
jgi:hypothetical protein